MDFRFYITLPWSLHVCFSATWKSQSKGQLAYELWRCVSFYRDNKAMRAGWTKAFHQSLYKISAKQTIPVRTVIATGFFWTIHMFLLCWRLLPSCKRCKGEVKTYFEMSFIRDLDARLLFTGAYVFWLLLETKRIFHFCFFLGINTTC